MEAIGLPARTREILEAKLREQQTLQILLKQQNSSIEDLVAAVRELLNVPAGWQLVDLAVGFTPPAGPPE